MTCHFNVFPWWTIGLWSDLLGQANRVEVSWQAGLMVIAVNLPNWHKPSLWTGLLAAHLVFPPNVSKKKSLYRSLMVKAYLAMSFIGFSPRPGLEQAPSLLAPLSSGGAFPLAVELIASEWIASEWIAGAVIDSSKERGTKRAKKRAQRTRSKANHSTKPFSQLESLTQYEFITTLKGGIGKERNSIPLKQLLERRLKHKAKALKLRTTD